jgi:hypothetical protein
MTSAAQNGTTHSSVSGVAGTAVTTMFQGFNTFTGAACGSVLNGATGSLGAQQRCDYKVCYSYDDLRSALEMSAAVGVDFVEGSVDVKTNFLRTLNLTTNSVVIAVYANRITSSVSANDVRLQPRHPSDLNAFFQAFGDSYVSQLVTGAEYIALYVFYAQSQSEQMSIGGQLQGKQITDGGALTENIQTALSSLSEFIDCRQTFSQMITGFSSLALPDPSNIVTFATQTFATATPDLPAVISYATSGYEDVPGIIAFSPVVATRNLFLGYTGQQGLSDQLAALSLLNNQTVLLKQCYSTYGYTGDVELQKKAGQIQIDLTSIGSLIQKILADPTQTYSSQSYASLGYGTPQLNVELSRPVVWGGDGGATAYADVTPASVYQQTRLTALQVHGGSYVDNLITTYEAAGSAPVTIEHGGGGGSPGVPYSFDVDEFITGVNGWYGGYVNQLGFTTTKGSIAPFPPTPKSAPNAISWTVPSGWVFLGFQGHYGSYLDQCIPVICQFGPAIWSDTPAQGA